MTMTLVWKLLRDIRVSLVAVLLLLALFQGFWVQVTSRVLGDLSPYVVGLANASGKTRQDVEEHLFQGSGKIVKSIIGGDRISLDHAMDMLSIGYVHPLMQTLFCVWAIGRASGAIAGEIDRGTMELLLAQPLARFRVVLAHLLVDVVVIPVLCLSLVGGTALGSVIVGPIVPKDDPGANPLPSLEQEIKVGPIQFKLKGPPPVPKETPEQQQERLAIHLGWFFPGLLVVGGLLFAVSGATMWLSAAGRFRWRVMGVAVFVMLVQFLVNLLGQLWEPMGFLRPLTLFYYFQPQQVILSGNWYVTVHEWGGFRVPMLAVLYGVGAVGYAMALWTFHRRDLPAPL